MPRVLRKIDWRELKNREELFLRYFRWRYTVYDLDHSHYCKVLTDGLTIQQKTWFSFLFGMTYRTPQAYAYWWMFPDFEQINVQEVTAWHADNWKRTSYGTDVRYNKGHFHEQVASLIEWKGEGSLYGRVRRLTQTGDARRNFEQLFAAICRVFKFGRMTAWITCQCLYDVLGLPIDFDNVLIRSPASDSSMKSIWNGYCILKGQYERLLGETYGGKGGKGKYVVTVKDLAEVAADIMRWRERASEYVGSHVDVFKWESIWCQFKRLFREGKSWEYPGHSSGDAVSRYLYYREHWPEVDWAQFREALLSQPGIVRGQTFVTEHNYVFGRTGLLLNMHEMYPDMPDARRILNLDLNETLVRELFEDHGLEVPVL